MIAPSLQSRLRPPQGKGDMETSEKIMDMDLAVGHHPEILALQ